MEPVTAGEVVQHHRHGRRKLLHAPNAAEAALNGSGRLLIRESGTEPLIRVMAEADDEALVNRIVDELCDTIAAAAGMREAAD